MIVWAEGPPNRTPPNACRGKRTTCRAEPLSIHFPIPLKDTIMLRLTLLLHRMPATPLPLRSYARAVASTASSLRHPPPPRTLGYSNPSPGIGEAIPSTPNPSLLGATSSASLNIMFQSGWFRGHHCERLPQNPIALGLNIVSPDPPTRPRHILPSRTPGGQMALVAV